jgi:hypothetical protein
VWEEPRRPNKSGQESNFLRDLANPRLSSISTAITLILIDHKAGHFVRISFFHSWSINDIRRSGDRSGMQRDVCWEWFTHVTFNGDAIALRVPLRDTSATQNPPSRRSWILDCAVWHIFRFSTLRVHATSDQRTDSLFLCVSFKTFRDLQVSEISSLQILILPWTNPLFQDSRFRTSRIHTPLAR